MEQSFDIKAEIKNILALCQRANPYGTSAQKEADKAFWLAVTTLDRRSRVNVSPVTVGRFVRLPAKDSYAYYIVTKVTKKVVKLTHIPYGLKYESAAVRDGEADFGLIESTIGWYDQIQMKFSEMGRSQTSLVAEN